jgi:hypothetical protein
MAATTTTTASDTETGRITTIKDLADKVDAIIDRLGKSGTAAPAAGGADIGDQVRRAVDAAREQDRTQTAAQAQAQATEDRLKALEARTEKRPAAYSALTKWLWGTGEED